jgi:hypothetical protein
MCLLLGIIRFVFYEMPKELQNTLSTSHFSYILFPYEFFEETGRWNVIYNSFYWTRLLGVQCIVLCDKEHKATLDTHN